jgi:hypothetical protein
VKNKTVNHLVIPDVQAKAGVPTTHLEHIGKYIVHKQPEVIVCLGDFADMPSLSSYDRGTKGFEGRRYKTDIVSTKKAMDTLLGPIHKYNKNQKRNKKTQYKPRMVMILGNHENRINRAINSDAILEGTISVDDLGYEEAGWEVHKFLDTVTIDGVTYSHFFPRSNNGRVMQNTRGAPSALAQGQREMRSCTSGHLQGLDFNVRQLGDRRLYNIIAGSCYLHDEDYLSPQGTEYWRGIVHKFDVKDGMYDPLFLSLDYLERRYK